MEGRMYAKMQTKRFYSFIFSLAIYRYFRTKNSLEHIKVALNIAQTVDGASAHTQTQRGKKTDRQTATHQNENLICSQQQCRKQPTITKK